MNPVIFILATVAFANGDSSHESAPAKLIEATQHESCPWDCGPFDRRSTEYCIDVGGQILVGERAGLLWLGETDEASMRNLVGKPILARFDARSIWISDNGHRTIKIKRGRVNDELINPGQACY